MYSCLVLEYLWFKFGAVSTKKHLLIVVSRLLSDLVQTINWLTVR